MLIQSFLRNGRRSLVDKVSDLRSRVNFIVAGSSPGVCTLTLIVRSAHLNTVCHGEMGNGTIPSCKNFVHA